MSQALIFDIGGVLIEWNPRHLYRKLFKGDETGMEHFLTHICSDTWNQRQDAGRSFAEGVAELSARYPDLADLIAAYDERWEEMVPGAIEDSVGLFNALKRRGCPIYGLTNFSREKFALTQQRFPFLETFDGLVVSARVGLVKPNPAIYRHLLDRYQLQAEKCIFVDDSRINVEAAAKLGMQAIRFESPAQLRTSLAELGLF